MSNHCDVEREEAVRIRGWLVGSRKLEGGFRSCDR